MSRLSNELRVDDQKVRELACEILGLVRQAVVKAEADYRRERIPAPSRSNPFPDPAATAGARRLESLHAEIGRIEGHVRHAATPQGDQVSKRYRDEEATLGDLAERDRAIVDHAETLRKIVVDRTPDQMLEAASEIEQAVARIDNALAARRLMIL